MSLKLNVGLSKKIGQPNYGSLGASCHVEVELDPWLLQNDQDRFYQQVRRAFSACRRAVHDELYDRRLAAGQSSGHHESAHAASRNGNRRCATAGQVRAIHAIAHEVGVPLTDDLQHRFGVDTPDELWIEEASQFIDELRSRKAPRTEPKHRNNGAAS
jgi:hypothetical protein